jgi:hypothetical protein
MPIGAGEDSECPSYSGIGDGVEGDAPLVNYLADFFFAAQ